MQPQNAVEFADQLSRRRAIGTAAATLVFLGVQLVARPVFRSDGSVSTGLPAYMWVANAVVLLLFLLPAGGFIWGRRVRELVNDEVSRSNSRAAQAIGFWLAMLLAFALYVLPASQGFTAREVAYVIITPTVGITPLAFAWLESRAHRDA
jgi:hypothetical protein